MNRKHLLPLIIFIILLAACQPETVVVERALPGSAGGVAYDAEPTDGFNMGEEGSVGSVAGEPTDSTVPNFSPAQQSQPQERLIIRNGNIDIVVEDTEMSLTQIGRLATRLGGWTVMSELRQFCKNVKSGTITLRIPAEAYDEMVNEVKEMALEVTYETSSSQDVTDEFVDLNSRLTNLEATAERVRAFLDEAETVEEALSVNQELSRLESDIEVIKGRMQFLSQSAAYSTLTISLTPDIIAQPIEVAGWRPEGTAKNAVEALVSTLQTLADVGIVVGLYFLPLALLFGVPGVILFRVVRNWWRRKGHIGETALETAE
jgi:hypothetical protein